ncbi:regulatory protein RecX [Jiella avicenniae]|uniref:Regulatory protein RecX n=1 Tax=Jiella avicenniae TaxID=2907202 RepID=A0A9X1NXP5_9HYPH|nr:RecX family transcriptional regulator [Jiella avicenniae]MCE7026660.1 RecX family transcriptional regulator [Jiella avicenniae]
MTQDRWETGEPAESQASGTEAVRDSPGGRTRSATRSPGLKPVSADWLMRAAGYYLERYASSTENLRRVLRRKVKRRAAAAGEDADQHEPLIEATLARFAELGFLDDRAYASARLSSLRRKGTSRTMAAAKLKEKGVPREIVETTLDEDETGEADAAAAYARRRRFGPHRSPGRGDRRDKEIAAMLRAGFSFRLAVAAIDGTIAAEDGLSQRTD